MFSNDRDAGQFVRVHFHLEYIVPADRPDMIECAQRMLLDDILQLYLHNEDTQILISVDDAKDATDADVSESVYELCNADS